MHYSKQLILLTALLTLLLSSCIDECNEECIVIDDNTVECPCDDDFR